MDTTTRADRSPTEETNRSTENRYDPPFLTDLGDIRTLTLGNSSSGNADANSQYYW